MGKYRIIILSDKCHLSVLAGTHRYTMWAVDLLGSANMTNDPAHRRIELVKALTH
jgi:hypothetical protein